MKGKIFSEFRDLLYSGTLRWNGIKVQELSDIEIDITISFLKLDDFEDMVKAWLAVFSLHKTILLNTYSRPSDIRLLYDSGNLYWKTPLGQIDVITSSLVDLESLLELIEGAPGPSYSVWRNVIKEHILVIKKKDAEKLYDSGLFRWEGINIQNMPLKDLDKALKNLDDESQIYVDIFKKQIKLVMDNMEKTYTKKALEWPSSEGPINVDKMSDSHIFNAIKTLKRSNSSFSKVWTRIFFLEVAKRKKVKKAKKDLERVDYIKCAYDNQILVGPGAIYIHEMYIEHLKEYLKKFEGKKDVVSNAWKDIIGTEISRKYKLQEEAWNELERITLLEEYNDGTLHFGGILIQKIDTLDLVKYIEMNSCCNGDRVFDMILQLEFERRIEEMSMPNLINLFNSLLIDVLTYDKWMNLVDARIFRLKGEADYRQSEARMRGIEMHERLERDLALANQLTAYINNYSIMEKTFDKYIEMRNDPTNNCVLRRYELIGTKLMDNCYKIIDTKVGEVAIYEIAKNKFQFYRVLRRSVTRQDLVTFKRDGTSINRLVVPKE